MKCLRCGKVINKNDDHCKHCGHYYESNLKKKKSKNNFWGIFFTCSMIIIILVDIILPISYFVISKKEKNDTKEQEKYEKKYNYCIKVCENDVEKISNNKCYCNNGTTFNIE